MKFHLKKRLLMTRTKWVIVTFSVIWPAFIVLSLICCRIALDRYGGLATTRTTYEKDKKFSSTTGSPKDKLLGGLVAANFTESSCLSRHQLNQYRKSSPHEPSSYLISKFRSYESMHKRCAPHTNSYNRSIEQLLSNSGTVSSSCSYVVHLWMPHGGIGNRLISLVSSFLYSILTDRVLLIDQGSDMIDLLCEPFPNSTWGLPSDFPIRDWFKGFNASSTSCYGNIVEYVRSYKYAPSFMYINLPYDYNDNDKRFFCEVDQGFLPHVPWLFIKSDQYFIPSLFSIPSFEKELRKLFPETETVFHHLGRYLLLPSNHVWGLVTRFYQAFLAKADERIGIQVRDFSTTPLPFRSMKDHIYKYYIPHLAKSRVSIMDQIDLTTPLPYMMDKMLSCSLKYNLLPKVINHGESIPNQVQNPKSKAVLVTSLNSTYFETLSKMYSENPTISGEVIGVFQPSHEEYQQNENPTHNMQALAEIYLLSLMDELITSPWSTFGYVAQGLGALKPWIMSPKKTRRFGSPCHRARSMEPCFHYPPFHDCKTNPDIEPSKRNSYVRHCEDILWGLKLFGDDDKL